MSFPRSATDSFTLFSDSSTPAKPIDETYIAAVEKKINASWAGQYADVNTDYVYVQNNKKNAMCQRYNPFNLRLPYQLEGFDHLYDNQQITLWHRISYKDASITYLNFLRQYNLAYLTFLRAINGSAQAINQLKDLFTTQTMFENARVQIDSLSTKAQTPVFLLALLAYLSLDILYSKEKNISTNARIKALEIISTHFDVEKLGAAFSEFNLGYYAWDSQSEPLFDLIPKRFVIKATESGGTPQNELFICNTHIEGIFQIPARSPRLIDLDRGISTLLNKYPGEMLQVLNSFVRCHALMAHDQIKIIFVTIVSLSKLDGIQKGQIFGANASYRNDGESKRGVESRVGWLIGSDNFGDYLAEDELNTLSNEDLKMRVRQSAHRIYQLECELIEAGSAAVLHEVNADNDPKGYFATLLLHPNTPEENFEELLKRNYRVLALKHHPDRPTGNEVKFRQLNEAYEFLLDKENRKHYRADQSRSGFGYGK